MENDKIENNVNGELSNSSKSEIYLDNENRVFSSTNKSEIYSHNDNNEFSSIKDSEIYLDNENRVFSSTNKSEIYLDNENRVFSSTNKSEIYLDNGATTKVDEEVLKTMNPYFNYYYGNPSSLHKWGVDADNALFESREIIAKTINCEAEELIFTSGGTESNNFVIKGIVDANKSKGSHIITTKIEHDCILSTCKYLQKQGYEVTYLDVDEDGVVDINQLTKSIRDDTIIVSVIHGNNEVGTIQNIKKIGQICKDKNVLFHSDACQSYTKLPIDVKEMNIDLLTINSHKIHGPNGVGALFIKKGISITPLMHGGGQEFKKRSGTSNVSGIVGFAKSCEIGIRDMEKNFSYMTNLRDYLINELLKISHSRLNGTKGDLRLSNNVNITFDFVEGEAMLMHLDLLGVAVSTGSACSSKSLEPSHVLTAMGRRPEQAHGTLRFTLSKYNTKEELDITIEKVKKVVDLLRKLSPLTQVI